LSEKAFLDTTIFWLREFGDSATKANTEAFLRGKTKATSSYVQMEINRTVLKDAIFLHSLMQEEGNLPAVFIRLQSYPQTDRRVRRCVELLGRISQQRQLRLADSIAKLENLIVALGQSMYLRDVKVIASGTNCPLSCAQIGYVSGTYGINTSCTRGAPECNVSTYMKSKTSDLKRVLDEIMTVSDLSDLSDLLKEVLVDSQKAKGRNCMVLGDLIICLDSPSDYVIYSSNTKDFGPICRSLAKPFAPLS
jgi:hypothetical protein